MTTKEQFDIFLSNLKVDNSETISSRYKEITKKLNQRFRNTDSETANSLQVGSYGRYTGIKGISDLDMLYIMPSNLWDEYKDAPAILLAHTRDALKKRYPNTDITYDTLVVVVKFKNFKFEVQPVFEDNQQEDGIPVYKFPHTGDGDSYKTTKPRHELNEMRRFKNENGNAHRYLCKIMRAWKDNVGQVMGGLLLDTLAYNYMKNDENLAKSTLSSFDIVCRDFFAFLKDQPKQDVYKALGSGQNVKVKRRFQNKAKQAYNLAVAAIAAESDEDKHDKWREIFGNKFPKASTTSSTNKSYEDREEFIEDLYNVAIQGNVTIDCEVRSNGFRERLLRAMLLSNQKIQRVRSLDFFIDKCDIDLPYEVRWKIRNVGAEARRRNCLRGQIETSNRGLYSRHESADFHGSHYVECYIIKDNCVVARDRINVPII